MSDEQPPAEPPKLTPEQIKGIQDFTIGAPDYMVRDQVTIPDDAVSHWTDIAVDKPVSLTLTRGDFDRLYFAITQMNASSTFLAQTIRLITFGDIPAADATHRKAQEMIQSADGNFRLFFTAVMKGATANGG